MVGPGCAWCLLILPILGFAADDSGVFLVYGSDGRKMSEGNLIDCKIEKDEKGGCNLDGSYGLTSTYHFMVDEVKKGGTVSTRFNFQPKVLTIKTAENSGVLKVVINSGYFFGQNSCETEFPQYFKVLASHSGDFDQEIGPSSVIQKEAECIGLFHFTSKFSGKVALIKRNITSNPMIDKFENIFDYSFEFLVVEDCPPKPLSHDLSELPPLASGGRINAPEGLATKNGGYFGGLDCHYLIEMPTHCGIVLAFDNIAFKSEEECQEIRFNAHNDEELFHHGILGSYDCSQIAPRYNPPWLLNASTVEVIVEHHELDEYTMKSGYSTYMRKDEFTFEVFCLDKRPAEQSRMYCSPYCRAPAASDTYQTPCWSSSAKDCLTCQTTRAEDMCQPQCPPGQFISNGVCTTCNQNCIFGTSCHGADRLSCNRLCNDSSQFRHEFEVDSIREYMCVDSCPGTSPYWTLDETDRGEKDDRRTESQQRQFFDAMCAAACPAGTIPDGRRYCIVPAEEGPDLLIVLLIPAVVSAMLVLLVVLIIWGWKRNRKAKVRKEEKLRDFYVGEGAISKSMGNQGKLQILDADEIKLNQVVGKGAFGVVYAAVWTPKDGGGEVHLPVAVKQLHASAASAEVELLEEAALMASVDNPHLVRLVAICMSEPMMLVTKFMVHGAALPFIRQHKDEMTSYQFMEWSRQLAAGMGHLETKGMIHRDLAGRNVLVESPRQIRISDFGLSKILNADKEEVEYRPDDDKLPIRWLAKECLTDKTFTHKSDVWAYGVTLWEFYTYGMRPYGDQTLQQVKQLVIRGRRLVQPPTCSLDLYTMLLKCWMGVPENRPSFTELEKWFAESRSYPSKYFFTEKRDEQVGAPAGKLQSNQVNMNRNLGGTSGGSNEKATVEAELPQRERTGRTEHAQDTSVPYASDGGSDEYLVPQSQQPGGAPSNMTAFIPESEYMRPMPRTLQGVNATSVESETPPDISLESTAARARLQEHFPQFNPDNFAQASRFVDYGGVAGQAQPQSQAASPDDGSNYSGIPGVNNDTLRGSVENLEYIGDRKERARISQKWKRDKSDYCPVTGDGVGSSRV